MSEDGDRPREELPWLIRGEEPEIPEADQLVERLVYTGSKHLLVSLPKAGKSTFTLAMCAAIRNREAFLGLATEPANILYLTEEPAAPFEAKLDRFGIEAGDEGFRFIRRSMPGVLGRPWAEVAELTTETARKSSSELVVVDVLHRWADFGEEGENRSGVVREAIGALDPLTEAGVAVWVLHHMTWSRRSRGSTDIMGAVDVPFYLERDEAAVVGYQGGRHDAVERLTYRLDEEGLLEPLGSDRLSPASKTAQLIEVLERLGRPVTTEEVAEELGWSTRTVLKWASRAHKHRLVGRETGAHNAYTWRKRRLREYLRELA